MPANHELQQLEQAARGAASALESLERQASGGGSFGLGIGGAAGDAVGFQAGGGPAPGLGGGRGGGGAGGGGSSLENLAPKLGVPTSAGGILTSALGTASGAVGAGLRSAAEAFAGFGDVEPNVGLFSGSVQRGVTSFLGGIPGVGDLLGARQASNINDRALGRLQADLAPIARAGFDVSQETISRSLDFITEQERRVEELNLQAVRTQSSSRRQDSVLEGTQLEQINDTFAQVFGGDLRAVREALLELRDIVRGAVGG